MMKVFLQADFPSDGKELSDLFWKHTENDESFQTLVSLWLQSTQEVAGKLQSKTATKKEKSAVLNFLIEVGVVVIERHLTTQPPEVQNTEVATVGTDTRSSSHGEISIDAREQSEDDVNPVRNIDNIPGPPEEQVDQNCLRGDKNIKQGSLDNLDMNKEEEERIEGEEGEDDDDDANNEDDDDEDYVPDGDANSDGDDSLEEVDCAGGDKETVTILQEIESSLKEIQSLSEASAESDAKAVDTADGVQLSVVNDSASDGKQKEASETKQMVEVCKNNVNDSETVTDITLSGLGCHIETKHQEDHLIKCEKCFKLLKTENFKDHECVKSRVEKNKKSNVCGDAFSTSVELVNHSRQHQKASPVVTRSQSCAVQLRKITFTAMRKAKTTWCDLCKRSFASVDGYRSHVRIVHEKYKPHLCNVCGKGFNRPSQLKAHCKVHDPNRKPPPRVNSSRKEKTLKTKYQCKECFKSYKTRRLFEKHQCTENGSASDGVQKETSETKEMVEVYKNNVSESEAVTDITSGTPQYEGVTRKEQELADSSSHRTSLPLPNDFKCKICFDIFDDASSLQQHIEATHNKYKKHACTLCDKRFFRPCLLRQHVENMHQEGHLTKCEKCFKSLRTDNFKDHVCVKITARKNKRCNVCGDVFLTSAQLANHSKQHQKAPSAATRSQSCALQLRKNAITAMRKAKTTWCDLCKMRFVSVNGYRAHVRIVHEKYKPHLCSVCGKGFNRPSQLKEHTKIHDPNRKLPPRTHPSRKGKTFETKYQCKKCFKSYKTRLPFERHQCKESVFKFRCKLCGLRSKTEAMLKKHDAEFHKRTKNYFCDVCGSGFVKRSDMNRHHKLYHEGQYMGACRFCGKVFRNKWYLRKHEFDMHQSTKNENETRDMVKASHQCEICGKLVTSERALKVHKFLHIPKRFQCNLCEAMFKHKSQLKGHQESVHFKLREKMCHLCGKGFHTEGRVQEHIRQVHERLRPHACQECGKGFFAHRSLLRHLKAHERKKRLQAIPRPTFPCDQCDRVCTSNSLLISHQLVHNPERNFKCTLCDRAFKQKGALETHHRSVHLGIKRYKCPKCDKRFTGKSALKVHMQRMHSEDGINKVRFACELCDRVLPHKSEYEEHQEWHKGLRKFICDVCGKEFSSRTPLQRHQKIHVDDSWRCSDCGKGFKNNELRAKHRMQVHLGVLDWNKCKECDKEFTTHQSLLRHMKNHKGIAWKCAFCGDEFPTVYAKEKHRKEQHGKNERGQTFGQL